MIRIRPSFFPLYLSLQNHGLRDLRLIVLTSSFSNMLPPFYSITIKRIQKPGAGKIKGVKLHLAVGSSNKSQLNLLYNGSGYVRNFSNQKNESKGSRIVDFTSKFISLTDFEVLNLHFQ
jgi:hypothetical protein